MTEILLCDNLFKYLIFIIYLYNYQDNLIAASYYCLHVKKS